MILQTLTRVTVLGALCAFAPIAFSATTLNSEEEKMSYAIGVDLGKKFQEQELKVNPDILIQGFKDVQAKKALLLEDKEMSDIFTNVQKTMLERRIKQFQKASVEHADLGKKYLETNKAKPGVTTTASGLQYRVIKAGTGAKPTATDTVSVDYTGKTIDGKVFDTTKNGGKPAEFRVNQVIPGWQEALQLMQAGAEWEVVIPAELAYGARGAGQMIGPNETLVFEIHLLEVKAEKVTAKK